MGVHVNQFYKNLSLWLVISLMMILLFNMFNKPKPTADKISYSDFISQVEAGKITAVTIQGNDVYGKYEGKDGKDFRTYKPNSDADLTKTLLEKKVTIVAKPEEEKFSWFSIFISWFPLILLVGVWIFFMRQMQVGGGKAMSFGKSRAKLLTESQVKITFEDVAGIEEAKEELNEIISFLKDPKKFTKLGGRIPKGVLLMGPPGTGKTLLARAIAGEAGVPFFTISGSDFVEMFVGVGASRVRDMFEQAKKNAPCIVFIDEIDAVGRHRGAGLGGGNDEREQTLNQLLVEMDGFESNEGVILIAATNRPDVLDPALQRPGRFDRRIVVPRPDLNGRIGVLLVHTKRVPLAPEVDLEIIARGTPGMTGADLENLVNEAALFAARHNKDRVEVSDFESAKDKVFMGPERKSMIMSEKEKRNTAVHEAGHALVAKLLPGCDPVHKVTIIPRGQALGVTWSLPTEDRLNLYRQSTLDRICMAMGGRIAEELVFNEISSGAVNDIERATETARAMVCRWGMSSKLGPLAFGAPQGEVFLGRDLYSRPDYSEETARQIDEEVREIVMSCYERAKKLLQENFDTLNRIANGLIEYETLEADDVEALVKGGSITRDRPKPRVNAPPKLEKKDKRKILDALEPLPALEPNKA